MFSSFLPDGVNSHKGSQYNQRISLTPVKKHILSPPYTLYLNALIILPTTPWRGDTKGADEMVQKIRRLGPWFGLAVFLLASVAQAQVYYVRPGDSLYSIANRFNTNIGALQSTNRLTSSWIYPGQALYIPGSSWGSSNGTRYTVAWGDSLFKIAARYGTTVEALRRANNLVSDQIVPGQSLSIPVSGGSSSNNGGSYTVRPNDSLYKLAQQYGTTVDAIKSLNGLKSNEIRVGQVLLLPSGSAAPPKSNPSFSASDLDLLARLVRAEAEGESFEGKVAVAATILNRLKDPRYPSSIPGIIYQVTDGRYYQYSPVLDGRINLSATTETIRAVEYALKGWDPSKGAVGFYNPAKTTNTWVRSHPITVTIGGHVFFKN